MLTAALTLIAPLAQPQPRIKLQGPTVEFSVGGALQGAIADYGSIQDAVKAAPQAGAIIRIRPGVYREAVHIERPGIQLRGVGNDPSKVLVIFSNGPGERCGAACSATVSVTADDFYAEGLTIQNDSDLLPAAALRLAADRAVLRNVRLLGRQQTLQIAAPPCSAGCSPSRLYLSACLIEGTSAFIVGTGKAVFADCDIRILESKSASAPAEERPSQGHSTYVLDHGRLTTNQEGASGLPWQPDASVILLHTQLSPTLFRKLTELDPSCDPGADKALLLEKSTVRRLSQGDARAFEPQLFLKDPGAWDPERVR